MGTKTVIMRRSVIVLPLATADIGPTTKSKTNAGSTLLYLLFYELNQQLAVQLMKVDASVEMSHRVFRLTLSG